MTRTSLFHTNSRFVTGTLVSCGLFLAIGLSSTAQAGEYNGAYATIGVTQISADLDLSDLSTQGTVIDLGQQSANINMISGRFGYRFADYFAVEAEGGFGLGGDSFQQSVPVEVAGAGTFNVDTDVNLDISNYGGIFARGIVPLGDQFELFARAGYGFAKAEVDAVGTIAALPGLSASASQSETASEFAYGLGAQYNINATHGVRLDYASFGGDFDVISLGYAINF